MISKRIEEKSENIVKTCYAYIKFLLFGNLFSTNGMGFFLASNLSVYLDKYYLAWYFSGFPLKNVTGPYYKVATLFYQKIVAHKLNIIMLKLKIY